MKFWPITLHVELHFDSFGLEPNPWWAPFLWIRHPWEQRRIRLGGVEDDPMNGFILRCGALGVHFCVAIHWYSDQDTITQDELTP